MSKQGTRFLSLPRPLAFRIYGLNVSMRISSRSFIADLQVSYRIPFQNECVDQIYPRIIVSYLLVKLTLDCRMVVIGVL